MTDTFPVSVEDAGAERNEFYAYYRLRGQFDPDDITKRMGITPTRTWRKGDRVRHHETRVHTDGRWELESKLERSAAIEDHIQSVLDQLRPAWTVAQQLGKRYDAQIQCVIYMYEAQGGGVYLAREVLRLAVSLNAYIDIDSYCLAGEDD